MSGQISRPGCAPIKVEIYPNQRDASAAVAKQALGLARKQKGTLLLPGCNSPLTFFYIFCAEAKKEELDLMSLLTGRQGDFYLGMIDGTETKLADQLSFPYYFCQFFLTFLFDEPFESQLELANGQEARLIKSIFSGLEHVYVPWIPKRAALSRKMEYVAAFNDWLQKRLPIDLLILGLGPDHIAFLGKGSDPCASQLAARVRLWSELKEWKWGNNAESCICAQTPTESCELLKPPSHALTITLPVILSAKHIILMAFGAGKAAPVFQLLEGEYAPQFCTAQYLWKAEGEVTIVIDQASAAHLSSIG